MQGADPRALGFDPDDIGFVADPYPAYERLRATAPILYDEATDHWLVTRYDDVNALLRDRRFGRTYLHAATHEEMGHEPPSPSLDPFWHLINHGILDMEPPDHTRVRRLVSKAFTPRMVESMRAPVQELTDELVDAVAGGGTFDLLPAIAEPLPVAVIAELLGVPRTDRHLLRPWSADICRMYELHPTEEDAAVAVAASVEFSDYLRALSRERRAAPTGDLISELALVVDEGERLTEDELIGTCVLLLNAGHEATVNVTGNGWWALFRTPGALDRLRAEPALVPSAVEELMRWDTPLAVVRAVGARGRRDPRGARPARRGARPRLRIGQPRSCGLRLAGRAAPRPRAEPARHVRRGHPLLPGGAAGPPRASDVVRDGAAPPPRPRARGGAALEARLHHPGVGVAAGDLLKRRARCYVPGPQ